MAARSDISAGRAFVELWVKDYAFRRRLMEDEALFMQVTSQFNKIGVDSSPIDAIYGDTKANNALSTLYDDTDILTQATWQLNDALEAVMDTYLGLADMQGQGITLNAGGGQPGTSMVPTDTKGFDKEQLKVELMEGLEEIPREMITAMSRDVGRGIIRSKGVQDISQRMIGGVTKLPGIGGMVKPFTEKGKKDSGSADTVAEVPLTLLARSADMASKALRDLAGSSSGIGGMSFPGLSNKKKPPIRSIAGAAGDSAPVMAELVGGAKKATPAMGGLAAGVGSVTAALGPMAIAAAAAVPLLAGIDDVTGGTLSKSGMYPSWLKKIGDFMLLINPPLKIAFAAMKAFASVVGLAFKIVKPFVKLALIPLKIAMFALVAPFKAVSLAVKAVYLPFTMVRKAIDGVKATIKALPGLAMSAAKGVGKLASGAITAAKNVAKLTAAMAVGTWKAWSAGINSLSSGMRGLGKMLGIAGGAAAAFGAAITVPLSRAAKQFQEHGSKVKLLTQQYRHMGLSAEDASVYMYAASQAGGELGAMGEEERIKNIMMSTERGSKAFKEWKKQAELSGQVMGGSMLASASLLSNAYKRMKEALSGLWRMLGAAVAPAIADTTEVMVGAIRAITAWVKNNQKLILTVFKVAGAVGAAGTAIAAAGGALFTLGSALTPITALLAAVAGGMALVEWRTKAGATFLGSYKKSVVNLYETARTMLGPILQHFQDVFSGIKDAIKGGDLTAAVKIAWLGMKIAWLEGLTWLSEKTGGVFGGILADLASGKWSEAAQTVKDVVVEAFNKTKMKVMEIWSSVQDWMDGVWVGMQTGVNTAVAGIEVAWVGIFERLKAAAAEFLKFLRVNIIRPMVEQIEKMDSALGPLSTGVGARMRKGMGSFMDMEGKLQGSMLTPEQQAEKAAEITKEANDRNAKAEDNLALRRENRSQKLADADAARARELLMDNLRESDGASKSDISGKSYSEINAPYKDRVELSRLRKEARAKSAAQAQPDSIEKIRGTSSMVTSSAYAFGQYGGATKSPEKAMADEIKQQRKEANDREKNAQKVRDKLSDWLDKNPNLAPLLENLGFFAE